MAQNVIDPKNLIDDFDFIRFSLTDIYGISRGKTVPVWEAKKHLKDGIHVITVMPVLGPLAELPIIPGQEKLGNSGMRPDLSTLHAVPSAENSKTRVGEFLCETYWLETGSSMQCCPRAVARRQLERLDEMGYRLKSAAEVKFTLKDASTNKPAFTYDTVHGTVAFSECDEFMFKVFREMESIGIKVATLQSEYGAGKLEMGLAPAWDIAGADQSFICKQTLKELAIKNVPRLQATFFPREYSHQEEYVAGQLNISLWRKGENAKTMETNVFYDPNKEDNLSDIARWWLGGLVKHTRALSAFYQPTVNCYRAPAPGTVWALRACSWGINDRTTCYRMLTWNPEETRIELRPLSSACNHYLVMAGAIAAGIDGIRNKLEVPPGAFKEAETLPVTLGEALKALEDDRELVEALGEEFVQWFVITKRQIDLEKLKTSDVTDEDDEEGWENERKLYVNL